MTKFRKFSWTSIKSNSPHDWRFSHSKNPSHENFERPYNTMGGISVSPLANMSQSTTTSASATTSSGGSSHSDYLQTMSLNQTQVEKDLAQRPDDPVTESGLYAHLLCLDNYNELCGRKGLHEVMGVKWLRVLGFTQGVVVPDPSTLDSALRDFLETFSFPQIPKTSEWKKRSPLFECREARNSH